MVSMAAFFPARVSFFWNISGLGSVRRYWSIQSMCTVFLYLRTIMATSFRSCMEVHWLAGWFISLVSSESRFLTSVDVRTIFIIV